jgi:hypothetical protein
MNLKLAALALAFIPSCHGFAPAVVPLSSMRQGHANAWVTAPRARPFGASNADWEVVVAAELAARQKKCVYVYWIACVTRQSLG